MRRTSFLTITVLLLLAACTGHSSSHGKRVVTVSIPPFRYFVEAIADSDFVVNVMLPPGADHHTWEPLPNQITGLAGSEAFIMDGHLGFEMAWMSRFKEVNPKMKIADLSKGIELIEPSEKDSRSHEGHIHEGADPHYWLSPKEAVIMAANVRDILKEINPAASERYDENYQRLLKNIAQTDSVVAGNLREALSPSFMIFHPALAYMARDYGLEQISFEDEGKMPSPARMKELIDLTRSRGMKIILIQAEYDVRNAEVLAAETGTRLVVIDPLNPQWDTAVIHIGKALKGNDK